MESAPPRIEVVHPPRAVNVDGVESPLASGSTAAFDILETLGGARRFVIRHALLVTSLLWFLSGAQISLSLFVTQEPPRFPVCRPGDSTCRPNIALDVKDCTTPYHYMRPGISIVSTFDLPTSGCESRPWMNVSWIHSALFLGMLVGALTIAPMSDRKGRRPVMTMGVIGLVAAAIYSTMAHTIYLYGLARFLVGCSLSAVCLPSMAILSEVTLSRKRQWIVAVQAVSFAIAAGYVALLACVIPSWRLLTILVTLPAFFFVCGFPCCGGVYIESPRWLAAKGRMEDAFGTWLRIARISRVELPEQLNLDLFVKNEVQATHERLIRSDSDLEEELSMMSVKQMVTPDTLSKAFRTFPASIWIWTSIWIWIVSAFVYYGVLLDFGDLIASLRMEGWESALLHPTANNPHGTLAGSNTPVLLAERPHNDTSGPVQAPGAHAGPPNLNVGGDHPPLRQLLDIDTLTTVAKMLTRPLEHDLLDPQEGDPIVPALSIGKQPLGSLQSPIAPAKAIFDDANDPVKDTQNARDHPNVGANTPANADDAKADDDDDENEDISTRRPTAAPSLADKSHVAVSGAKDLQEASVERPSAVVADEDRIIPPPSSGRSRLSPITSILDRERAAAYLQYLSDVGSYVKNSSVSLYESAKHIPHEAERLYDEMAMQKRLDDFYSDVSAQFTPDDPMAPYWQKMRIEGLLVLVSFALEIPAYAIAMFMAGIPRIGRKSTTISLLTIGGISIGLAYAVQFTNLTGVQLSAATLGLVVAGRCCIAAVFQLLYLYSAELFPTSIRGSTLGLFSAAARVGCIVAAPLATYLDGLHNGLALCFFGSLCLAAALSGVNALPETLNQPLYDTLDTLEDIYARSRFADKFFDSYAVRCCAFLGRGTCCLGRLFSRCLGLPSDMEPSSFEAKGHAWLKKQWKKSRGGADHHLINTKQPPESERSHFVPIADDGKDPAPLASASTVRTFELGELDESYDEDSQRPRYDV